MRTRTEPGLSPWHSLPHSLNPSFLAAGLRLYIPSYPIHDPYPALPGEMTTLQTLDRERQSSYQLLVQVQDGGSPPRSTTGTVHIAVLDLNDNSPSFLQASGAAGGGLPIQVCEVAGLCPEKV